MNYPVWEVSFGSQWIIAFVAVVHVFISHFAIGGGLFLVAVELKAHRSDDAQLLGWLRSHTKFFLIVTLVLGALTGVGIWFTIGIASPEATSNLIHVFVWAWAIEWVFFLVEILAILVYAYTWDSLPKTTHRAVGWVYFATAWLSLAVINGILSFMLTPGTWLQSGSFWAGFFNPGYFPSLAIRTLICVILAGVYAFFTSSFVGDRHLRTEISRLASTWIWIPALLVPPAAYWYLHTVPQAHRDLFLLNPAMRGFVAILAVCSSLLVILSFAATWLRPAWVTRTLSPLLMILAFGAFGATEWVREDLRKPYIIAGYCYANQIPVRQEASIRKSGILASAIYVTDSAVTPQNRLHAGKELFRIACGPCHRPRHGHNALLPQLAGLDEPFVAGLVKSAGLMRGGMPPFLGNTQEAGAIAAYLCQNGLPPASDLGGPAVFARRCQRCHDLQGARRPILDALSGSEASGIADSISMISSDNMPAWSGSAQELKALSEYIAAYAAPKGGAK